MFVPGIVFDAIFGNLLTDDSFPEVNSLGWETGDLASLTRKWHYQSLKLTAWTRPGFPIPLQ